MSFYTAFVKPLLFRMDPERAHHFVFNSLSFWGKVPGVRPIIRSFYKFENPTLHRTVFGIDFPNPVGLAAGFDKDARLFNELSDFGFGFIEIGTVTPVGQPGNDQPRLFRLPQDEALINRMGFNNGGVKEAAKRLRKDHPEVIIGGNIGKNKVTPNENAVEDYLKCYDELKDLVDYFVVNVSSPNTPNLRELQEKGPLLEILNALQSRNQPLGKPILLKIAPDLTNSQLDDIVEIVLESGTAGVIATNTTIDRSGLTSSTSAVEAIGAGGLSGKPVTQRSTEVIRYLHDKSQGKFPIIGVGGIDSGEDALEKLRAGASLVQVYTGFIYQGPSLVRDINRYLVKHGLN
ncbi:MAG: quinone-dependent dihydroorotate dehydrogenase [Flavobacteriales bacterium]|nr:quinone-dependent dihydroorotate dehydrogenase [Flavobacteriales bacterium]